MKSVYTVCEHSTQMQFVSKSARPALTFASLTAVSRDQGMQLSSLSPPLAPQFASLNLLFRGAGMQFSSLGLRAAKMTA
jgi:hypothetical protein